MQYTRLLILAENAHAMENIQGAMEVFVEAEFLEQGHLTLLYGIPQGRRTNQIRKHLQYIHGVLSTLTEGEYSKKDGNEMNQRLSRLEDINMIILTKEFNELPPDKQGAIYHEALDLCEALGLDRAWRRYKEFLERLQTGWLAELKRRQEVDITENVPQDND